MGLAQRIGSQYGIKVKPTCDAKYLEVGISSKSDNVDAIFEKIRQDGMRETNETEPGTGEGELRAESCAFWGDEFVGIEEGIFGSDSFMLTKLTENGDFFDVSKVSGVRPKGVVHCGGGVERFLEFLIRMDS